MPRTTADLVTRALRYAGKVGTGQSPEPEDAAEMRDDMASTIATLYERRVVDARFILTQSPSVPIVPDAWFLPLARVLAFYGEDTVTGADLQTLAALSQAAQENFHEMVDTSDSDTPVKACFF